MSSIYGIGPQPLQAQEFFLFARPQGPGSRWVSRFRFGGLHDRSPYGSVITLSHMVFLFEGRPASCSTKAH